MEDGRTIKNVVGTNAHKNSTQIKNEKSVTCIHAAIDGLVILVNVDPKRKKLVLQYIITITKAKKGEFHIC